MIKAIAKLIAALNGNTGKDQIAAGFSWGLLLALIPLGNFFWIVLFVLSFIFRHHHGSKVLVMAILKLFTPLLYPLLIDPIGWQLLHIEALMRFYTTLYNTPFVLFTRFNNTLVTGGLATGLVLFVPFFFLVRFLVPRYRNTLLPKIVSSKLFQAISKLRVVAKLIHLVGAFEGDIG
jgi:uncharacterized protein (TIGR03546 family)